MNQIEFDRKNDRRVELIHKEYGQGLTEQEQTELADLQSWARENVVKLQMDPERMSKLEAAYHEMKAGRDNLRE